MPFTRREYKEPPSSDAETDKMEGIDERESQLEVMANGKRTLNVTVSSPSLKRPIETEDLASKKQKVATEVKEEEENGVDGSVADDDEANGESNNVDDANQPIDDNDAEGEEDEDEDEENNGVEEDNKQTKNEEKPKENEEEVGKGEDEGEDEEKAEKNDQLEEKEREEDRNIAMNGLKNIEIKFAKLKDKLYETQLTKLEFELKLCENNQHPELLDYMKMVDEDFKKKAERLMNLQKYKLKCLDTQTRANRVSLHQQFLKLRQDLKNKEIVKITTDWYDINKERRMMDMNTLDLPDYYQFNQSINEFNIQEYLPILTHQRNSVFKELSVLQGLINYKQMIPSSLNNLSGCSENEINSDLKEMGIKVKKEV